jgi:hypothetical protein
MQVGQVSVIDDNVIAVTESGVAVSLSSKNVFDLFSRVVVPCHGAFYLQLRSHIDHEDALTPGVLPRLNQQRIRKDGIGGRRRLDLAAQMLVDQRVQQALQPLSFRDVCEDPMSQLGPIQTAIVLQYVVTKVLRDCRQRGLARLDDDSTGNVRIDDGDAVCREPVGGGRLAAADSARQPDEVGADG